MIILLNHQQKNQITSEKLFIKHFGENRVDIIPNYWLPKWDKNGPVEDYVDPSARELDIYLSSA